LGGSARILLAGSIGSNWFQVCTDYVGIYVTSFEASIYVYIIVRQVYTCMLITTMEKDLV